MKKVNYPLEKTIKELNNQDFEVECINEFYITTKNRKEKMRQFICVNMNKGIVLNVQGHQGGEVLKIDIYANIKIKDSVTMLYESLLKLDNKEIIKVKINKFINKYNFEPVWKKNKMLNLCDLSMVTYGNYNIISKYNNEVIKKCSNDFKYLVGYYN